MIKQQQANLDDEYNNVQDLTMNECVSKDLVYKVQ